MKTQLPKDLEQFVQAKVQSGRFTSSDEAITEAVRLLRQREEAEEARVLEGHVVWTPGERNDVIAAASSNAAAAGGACVFDRLTAKEKLAVIELVKGSSVQEIAKSSGVSTATVRGRIQAIRSKLGASSQLALVAEAHKAGWPRPRSGRADVPVVAQSALYRSISSA